MSVARWESLQESLWKTECPGDVANESSRTAPMRRGSEVKEPPLIAELLAAYPAEARQSGVGGRGLSSTP